MNRLPHFRDQACLWTERDITSYYPLWQVLHLVRHLSASSHEAVFMLTGFGDIIKAKGEPLPTVDRLLSKPIVIEDLCRAVAELPERNP